MTRVSSAELDLEPPVNRPVSSGDGRPAQLLPVIRRHPETGLPTEGYLRWGLIPHTAMQRPDIQPIHARAESVAEKPMFRDAYRARRCIVPMNAFYLKDASGKRHAFAVKNAALFGVAGIWENWRDPASRQWERTFATITVEANQLIAPVHNRMPAILQPEDYGRWLGPEYDPRELLRPFPNELIERSHIKRR